MPARVSEVRNKALNGPGPTPIQLPPRVLPENHQEDESGPDGEMERRGLRREEEDHGSCLEENLSPDKPQGRWAAAGDRGWAPSRLEARVPLPQCQGELQTLQALRAEASGLRISHRTLSLQFVALEIQEERRCPARELPVWRGRQTEKEEEATRAKGGEPSSFRGQGGLPQSPGEGSSSQMSL